MKSRLFSAIAILVGTIVGAGIFGIPYGLAKIGFFPGLLYIIVLGVIVCLVTLCYGEVILRTKKYHQMTGYAQHYLGKLGKEILSFSLIFGIYGALLAYMIGVGNFLYLILGQYIGGSSFIYSIIFFIFGSLAILIGLKFVARLEKFMVVFLILAVFIIFIFGFSHIKTDNLFGFDSNFLFLPYGIILFAFTGATATADMYRLLKGEEKKLKKGILIGHIIPFIIYILFAFVVCGISGKLTTEMALHGLEGILGQKIIIIGAILGILTMSTSFLTLGLALKEIFIYDYKINRFLAWILSCWVPFIIFLFGLASFIKVIDLVGSIIGGLQGIIILLMFLAAKKKGDRQPAFSLKLPPPVIYLLFIVFGLGILYQIYYSFFS